MSTAVPSPVVLHQEPRSLLVHQDCRLWFIYPANASALAIRPARLAAMQLGFEHREPFATILTEHDGVQMVGVEMFQKEDT